MNQAEEDALIAKIASDKNAFPLEDHTVEEIVVTAMRLTIRAAVAHERERAAMVCENGIGAGLRGAPEPSFDRNAGANWALYNAAAAIRRGE